MDLTHEDVARLCGELADSTVGAILSTGGTINDLEVALAWARGEDDIMGEERRPARGCRSHDLRFADER